MLNKRGNTRNIRVTSKGGGWGSWGHWSRKANTGVRGNKYNAQAAVYDGHTYDSALEARYAQLLDWRKRAGDIKSWRRQVAFPLPPKDVPTPERRRRITIDFEETLNDDSVILTEIKGYPTEAFGVRWAWFRREYPNLRAQLLSTVRLPFEATK